MNIIYFTQEKEVHLRNFYEHFHKNNKITIIGKRSYRNFTGVLSINIIGFGFLSRINKALAKRYTQFLFQIVFKIRQPDIIHVIGAFSALLKPLIDMKSKISPPIIFTPSGSDIHLRPWFDESAKKLIEKVLQEVDSITVNSKFFKEFIVNRFNIPQEKCVVESWGIDIEKCEKINFDRISKLKEDLNILKGETVLLYPKGFRVKEKQNYFNILEAFYRLSQKNENLKLVMLSYGRRYAENSAEVKKWVYEKDLGNKVIIIDEFLPDYEVINLLYLADIVLVIPDVDQLSGVILEGLVCGIIPVLSDISAYRSYFKDLINCYYVNQKDPKSIETVLEFCIKNKESIKEKIAESNKNLVRQYFYTKEQMKKIYAIYEGIIQNQSKKFN
jgi:glycosyltransferase involved in cell wall biosynthesis